MQQESPWQVQSVHNLTLTERVVTVLKRVIVAENLQPGDQLLSERHLAARLGVSHTVVRGALDTLVGEGIIEKRHGRGSFIRDFDRNQIQLGFPDALDLFEARCALEIGIMPIVAFHATEDDFIALQTSVDQLRKGLEQGDSALVEDLRFHRLLLVATHNETLRQYESLIVDAIHRCIYNQPGLLLHRMDDERHVVEAHQAIVDALRTRNGVQALLAMEKHLRSIMQSTLTKNQKQASNSKVILAY